MLEMFCSLIDNFTVVVETRFSVDFTSSLIDSFPKSCTRYKDDDTRTNDCRGWTKQRKGKLKLLFRFFFPVEFPVCYFCLMAGINQS
jgi:hypothetical protein